MKINISTILVFSFLLILLSGMACYGQGKKDAPKGKGAEPKAKTAGHPKLVRNLGTLKDKGHNVQGIIDDKTGNLWITTSGDGVYKYDGTSFTQFTTANGLFTNGNGCILEDRSGKIWIGTGDGICLYDNHTFSKVQIATSKDTLRGKYNVWSIMQDKSGKIWFATSLGIYIYDGKSFRFFTVPNDIDFCTMKIEKIIEDRAGNFWLGGRCHDGIYRYDGKSFTKFDLKKLYVEGPTPRERNWGLPHLQDKKGNIWFSNWDGVYRYDGKTFTTFTKKDGLSGNMVCRIMEDKKGNIWLGGDGLTRYDGKTFTRFTAKEGLVNSSIWSILEDKTGAIWVGTRNTSLFRYDGKTFTNYTEVTESQMMDALNPFGN